MRFLIDMNMSPKWVDVLAAEGGAVHWASIGAANEQDSNIMAYAAIHGLIVFTNDLDFGHLLAQTNAPKPSVVQVRLGNLRVEVIGERVVDALQRMKAELDDGALMTIDPLRTRVRVLPVR